MRSAPSRAMIPKPPSLSRKRRRCLPNSTTSPGITRSRARALVSRLLPRPLALDLAKLEALHLAGLGARQVGHELDRPRVFVGRDFRLREVLDVLDQGVA